MNAWTLRFPLAAAFGLAGACRPAPPASDSKASVEDAAVHDSATVAPAPPAPRCRRGAVVPPGEDGAAPEGLLLGDAVPNPDGAAVGAVHNTSTGPMSAVLWLGRGGGVARWVDLAPAMGDAPPPKLAVRVPGDLLAAVYARPSASAVGPPVRVLTLYAVASEAAPKPLASIKQRSDDSFAFDLAWADHRGIVVWDEAARAGGGAVLAAALSGESSLGPSHDVSPPDSDVEAPRVVADRPGFRVVWLARSPDTSGPAADAADLEAPGETREHGWLEMVSLDEHGVVRGPVRKLTSPGGHVTAFDLQASGEGPKAVLLVVARDDGETLDGSGGALLRVRVTADTVEPPVALVSAGVGRGAPSLVGGASFSLFWVTSDERLSMLPIDAEGTPRGPSSAESGMDDARPLLWVAPRDLLAATASDTRSPTGLFACDP